jgi:hypothetical protein
MNSTRRWHWPNPYFLIVWLRDTATASVNPPVTGYRPAWSRFLSPRLSLGFSPAAATPPPASSAVSLPRQPQPAPPIPASAASRVLPAGRRLPHPSPSDAAQCRGLQPLPPRAPRQGWISFPFFVHWCSDELYGRAIYEYCLIFVMCMRCMV